MRWSERQQALLQGMGLRLWWPSADAAPPALADDAAAVPPAAVAAPAAAPEVVAPRPPAPRDEPARPAPAPVRAPAPGPGSAALPVALPVALPAALPAARPAATVAGRPDAAAIATMDWPALRDAVAGCQACGLCRTRRHTVFGVGHERAPLMVVGEAPGEQEDLQGEPFVGAAGQLLDRMLAAIGLARAPGADGGDGVGVGDDPARRVFIANTLKCRPPRNRNPAPEELATCQPFLQRQVALVQPRVILAMGRFAVQSLLGSDEAIGRLRGRVHRWQDVPVVVTYHPAYLLRQPADKAKAWDDLCRAAELLHPAAADGRHPPGG